MTQKIAIISDTHGDLHPDIAKAITHCDIAIHAGDVGNAEVIQSMQPKSKKLYLVKGNNDVASKWPNDQKQQLHELREQIILDVPGGQIAVIHGHKQNPVAARHALLRKLYPTTRAIVYGHSHKLCIDQEHTPWVLNPGAAGKARTYGGPSCLILHVSHGNWHLDSIRITD
ncbi:metallophosphoesterase family protein [Kaarinaea lacus]